MDAKKLALECRELADNRKAEDIAVLDVAEVSSIADYFVIASGTSEPHLRAIINAPLLEQAVVNLLDNAINYSKAGSTVWIEAAHDGSELLIAVRDQGVGIPQQHLPRLFERFYRVDKARSRDHGGTGLGLAIVKHIALVHGGRVSVTSAVGKGSTFTLQLPTTPPISRHA